MRTTTRITKNPVRFLFRLFRIVLPVAREELGSWRRRAEAIPDPELRAQALASLTHKRFHADGGCVYAAVDPGVTKPLVRAIVALQTISDYLDNLCDRCNLYDPADFRQLHHAMRDAVRPGALPRDYYQLRGSLDDGGYLRDLVITCQNVLSELPGYPSVQDHVCWLVERYCELQENKHIDPPLRYATLAAWCKTYQADYPELEWWEFAAATGSTLGVFALFLAATRSVDRSAAKSICDSYFPWVCSLHILLDYLIDLEEDSREGDFNFVLCYSTPKMALERIHLIAQRSWQEAKQLSIGGRIHQFVVQGLLGMYLSDRKAMQQSQVRRAQSLVMRFGPTAWVFYWACLVYRIVR